MLRQGRRARAIACAAGVIGLMGTAPAARADVTSFPIAGMQFPGGVAVLKDGTVITAPGSDTPHRLIARSPSGAVDTFDAAIPDGKSIRGLATGQGREVYLFTGPSATYRLDVNTGTVTFVGAFNVIGDDALGPDLVVNSEPGVYERVDPDGQSIRSTFYTPRTDGGLEIFTGLTSSFPSSSSDFRQVLRYQGQGSTGYEIVAAHRVVVDDARPQQIAARDDRVFAAMNMRTVDVYGPGGNVITSVPEVHPYGTVFVAFAPDGSLWIARPGGLDRVTIPDQAITPGGGCRYAFDDGPDTGDTYRGSSVSELINAGGGDDVLYGNGGNDCLVGEAGDDSGLGGYGNDYMSGGAGNDRFDGQDGKDELHGGAGNDDLTGASDPDVLFGDAGNDTLYGGYDRDQLSGGDGADVLFGQGEEDTIHGDAGDDVLIGAEANDVLFGDAGHDELYGGYDDDTLDGGADDDVLYGQAGADTMTGGAGNDELRGQGESDKLVGGDGDDELYGDEGNDELTGGAGNDHLVPGPDSSPVVSGGAGDDVVDAVNGATDQIDCGTGQDTVRADPGDTVAANCESVVRVGGTAAARKAHAKRVTTKGVHAPKPKRR